MSSQDAKRIYSKTKRNRVDKCNICGEVRELSYDHIPPKCCFNDIKAFPLVSLAGEEEKYNRFCSQNGVKFRSICKECNNGLLAKYDKELEYYVGAIKDLVLSAEALGDRCMIKSKPNRIARAICGHILAMRDSYCENYKIDQMLREYVMNEKALPPEGFKLLLRFYPYSTVFAIRDVTVAVPGARSRVPEGVISVLSSFPVAFVLSDGTNTCDMFDLFTACSSNIDETVEIPFDFQSAYFPQSSILRHMQWPCNISDDPDGVPMLLCTEGAVSDAVFANRKREDLTYRIHMKPK